MVITRDKTVTCQYLFWPESVHFHETPVYEAFKSLYDETFNVYVDDESKYDYDKEECINKIMYVLVDNTLPEFKKAIKVIEKSVFYVDRYLHEKGCVIRMKIVSHKRFKDILNSHFSLMYNSKEQYHLLSIPELKELYDSDFLHFDYNSFLEDNISRFFSNCIQLLNEPFQYFHKKYDIDYDTYKLLRQCGSSIDLLFNLKSETL